MVRGMIGKTSTSFNITILEYKRVFAYSKNSSQDGFNITILEYKGSKTDRFVYCFKRFNITILEYKVIVKVRILLSRCGLI